MLNNHEVNLTDEEAAAEVARVAKTYPVVRLLSADQIKSEPNCLLAGNRCPCLRQSSLEALADSDEVSEQLLNDGVEYRARLRPLKVEGEPHVLLMVRPIDEQFVRLTSLYAMAVTSLWSSCPIFPPMTSPVACIRCPMPFMPRLFRVMST